MERSKERAPYWFRQWRIERDAYHQDLLSPIDAGTKFCTTCQTVQLIRCSHVLIVFGWQQIILKVKLDFAPNACIQVYIAPQTFKFLLESNLLLHHRNNIWILVTHPERKKRVVMKQRGLFPSGSEFLHCFNANGFWLELLKKKRLTITQPLMYSSNLNINIHWAFVTFKILLDALQSIPFQISTSNYTFKLITTDQQPLIVFGTSSSPLAAIRGKCNWGSAIASADKLSGLDFGGWSQSFGLTLSRSLHCEPVQPHLALDDWLCSRKQRVYARLQPNNAGAKRGEREGLFGAFQVLMWGSGGENEGVLGTAVLSGCVNGWTGRGGSNGKIQVASVKEEMLERPKEK